jgi:N-acetylglucosamine kinase-like BadF-type ATPase
MVLIADGGSTKCDWAVLDTAGNTVLSTQTAGLNPAILTKAELLARLQANSELQKLSNHVSNVYFYGAGCGTEHAKQLLTEVFENFFAEAAAFIKEDLTAAVYAVTDSPGIVCILGTGSNSCYFDGSTIHPGPPSLGYIIMDEGSGNYFGKKLLADYFYKRMPRSISEDFQTQYDLSPNTIKQQLYKEPHPNAYLATLGAYALSQSENAYFRAMIEDGFNEFINHHVLCFEEAKRVPVHCVGSVAQLSKPIWLECLCSHSLQPGTVVQRPIEGLINYHKRKLTE